LPIVGFGLFGPVNARNEARRDNRLIALRGRGW
jgi:hypothetical protein